MTKPDLKCKWLRNGRTINPNEDRWGGRYLIISDGYKHSLTMKNLNLKDAGDFVVQVDELSSSCNFTVKECEKIPRIDLSQVPKYIKVKSGKDIDVEVPYDCKIILDF